MTKTEKEKRAESRRRKKLNGRLALPTFDPMPRRTVDEAIVLLRTSRASLYNLIKAGELRVIKEGRRTFVPGSEIVRLSSISA